MQTCPNCGLETEHLTTHFYRNPEHKPESWPECPKCGERFKNEQGMKAHHKRVHGESISGVKVNCSICGKSIRRQRKDVERNDGFVCSPECESKLKSQFFSGENHPQYKGAKSTVECPTCGSENIVYEGQNVGFCDHDCYGEWLTTQTGENAPNWKGGLSRYYGPNWDEQREKRLERDGYNCVVCEISNEEHKERYGQELEVHHIQPKSTFVEDGELDYKRANRIENLITLCRPCHAKWEGIPLRPQTNHDRRD